MKNINTAEQLARPIIINTAESRFNSKLTQETTTWEAFCDRIATTTRTPETVEEYAQMTKEQQGSIKDKGGFVAGELKDGSRRKGNVLNRSFIVLDADSATYELLLNLTGRNGRSYQWAYYTTHKHTPENMRFRVIVNLSRAVLPHEYEPLARLIAEDLGMANFDDTTYELARLMYWPTTSANGEFLADHGGSAPLDVDTWLERVDLEDPTTWPTSPTEKKEDVVARVEHAGKKQQDPRTKNNWVGAFCRVYSISEVIEEFLTDVYEPARGDRYTYLGGESSNGVVVYDDLFLYSHHNSDPAGGETLNAFDLVRLHMYGDLDEEAKTKETTKLPSYKAMVEMVMAIPEVRSEFMNFRTEAEIGNVMEAMSRANLSVVPDPDDGVVGAGNGEPVGDLQTVEAIEEVAPDMSWTDDLTFNKQGIEATLTNYELIMENDPKLQGIALNAMTNQLTASQDIKAWGMKRGTVWSNYDSSLLRSYICKTYRIPYNRSLADDALNAVASRNAFHPLQDWADALPKWDGVERLDEHFITYYGADDTAYIRAVTSKLFMAAIQRIYRPGSKFDNMLIINGPQGVGKSFGFQLAANCGQTQPETSFYTDSLTMKDIGNGGKGGIEKIQGILIAEISELAGMRKTEVEDFKSFITTSVDNFREPYAKQTSPHPRTCVLVGTTNETGGFLRDLTGNRRFWIIDVPATETREEGSLTIADLVGNTDYFLQFWAEAKERLQGGESLLLSGDLLVEAEKVQEAHMEEDERAGMVSEYLDMDVPDIWWGWNIAARRRHFAGFVDPENSAGKPRDRISNAEIWAECFGNEVANMKRPDSYAISAIMTKLGWTRADRQQRIPLYGKQRLWIRPGTIGLP